MNKFAYSILLIVVALSVAGSAVTGCSSRQSGKLIQVTVTPANSIVTAGSTRQFQALAIFSDGTTLDWTSAVTWSTSDETMVAIGNSLGTYGLATALATSVSGTTVTVTATDKVNFISGAATLMLTTTPLWDISVTPIDQFIIISAGTRTTMQYQATGTCTDGSTVDLTSLASWSSSHEAVATVSDTEGSKGRVTAVGGGTTLITANEPLAGVSGFTSLSVSVQ
jgi:hypothetical protein